MKHLARLAEIRRQYMAIKIKGDEYDPAFELIIKEHDIRRTFVHISKEFYRAKATIESYYGSVEINGSTLHNIVKEMLIQNKGFRSVITDYIGQLEAEDEIQDQETI